MHSYKKILVCIKRNNNKYKVNHINNHNQEFKISYNSNRSEIITDLGIKIVQAVSS